jgi:HEAT repeat protein/uncharacterized RDD family membrane protein YckC
MTCPLCGKATQPNTVFCTGCEAFVGTPGAGKRAPLKTRALALLLDGLLSLVALAVGYVMRWMVVSQLGFDQASTLGYVAGSIVGLIVPGLYAFWVLQLFKRGETPGKRALGLTVISDSTGAPAGMGQMFFREVFGHIGSALPLLAGYFAGAVHSANQTWHDRFCGTVVVASAGAQAVPVAMAGQVDDPEDILWESGNARKATVETWRPTVLTDQVAMIPTYRLDVGPTRGRNPMMRHVGYGVVACGLAVMGWGMYALAAHGNAVAVAVEKTATAPSSEGLSLPLSPAGVPERGAVAVNAVSVAPATAAAIASQVEALGGAEPARTQAVNNLVARGVPAVGALVEALGNTSRQIRTGACEALGRIGKPAVPALIVALQSSEPRVRLRACKALALVGPAATSAMDALKEVERDTNENIRKAASEAVAQVGGASEPLPPIHSVTASPEGLNPMRSVGGRPTLVLGAPAVGEAPPERAPAAVRETTDLESSDPSVRLKAVKLLAGSTMAPGSKVAPLIRALDDSSAQVRKAAAASLVAIGEPAVNGLTEALKDGSRNTRGWSAVALGKIGRSARGAVPALVEALKDSDSQVRKACMAALAAIQPRGAKSEEAETAPPAAPETAEATPPSSGKMVLSSVPSGAQLVGLTSGKPYGTTPCTLVGLKPGKWKFLLKAEGYNTQQVEVSVKAGETAHPKVKMAPVETASAAETTAAVPSPAPDAVPAGGEEDLE